MNTENPFTDSYRISLSTGKRLLSQPRVCAPACPTTRKGSGAALPRPSPARCRLPLTPGTCCIGRARWSWQTCPCRRAPWSSSSRDGSPPTLQDLARRSGALQPRGPWCRLRSAAAAPWRKYRQTAGGRTCSRRRPQAALSRPSTSPSPWRSCGATSRPWVARR